MSASSGHENHPARSCAVRRQDQLVMLSRLEWLVLRKVRRLDLRRWFARVSADAPELAIRISA